MCQQRRVVVCVGRDLLGLMLVTVVIRELGPLIVAFIVIGRSGAAIAAEARG